MAQPRHQYTAKVSHGKYVAKASFCDSKYMAYILHPYIIAIYDVLAYCVRVCVPCVCDCVRVCALY
jgi:hypothetical protein